MDNAGETLSDARMASEGPRATIKNAPLTVGLGPSHATRACERVPLAIVRAPDPVGQDCLKLWHICQAILTRL